MAYRYIGLTYGGYSGRIITWDYWHGFDYDKISTWFAHRIEWAENGTWKKSKDVGASHADWEESGESISNYCAVGFCLAKIPDTDEKTGWGDAYIDPVLKDGRCVFNYLPFDTIYRSGLAYRATDVVGDVEGASNTDEENGLYINYKIADIGDLVLIQNLPLIDEVCNDILFALEDKLGINPPDIPDNENDEDNNGEDFECWCSDRRINAVNKELNKIGLPKIGYGAKTTTYYFVADCCVEGKSITVGDLRHGVESGVYVDLSEAIERANIRADEEAEAGRFKGIGVYFQDVPDLEDIIPEVRDFFTGDPEHDIVAMTAQRDVTLVMGAATIDEWGSVYNTYKNTGEIKTERNTKTEQ